MSSDGRRSYPAPRARPSVTPTPRPGERSATVAIDLEIVCLEPGEKPPPEALTLPADDEEC